MAVQLCFMGSWFPLAPADMYEQQAEVTNWPERLALTVAVVLFLLAMFWLMWRGWKHREARQSYLAPLPIMPEHTSQPRFHCDGRYVGTVLAPDWLDRVVAQGMGAPGRAEITVFDQGLFVDRDGAQALFLPTDVLVSVDTGRGIAGQVFEKDGLVIITWNLADQLLATGVRADSAADQVELMHQLQNFVSVEGEK